MSEEGELNYPLIAKISNMSDDASATLARGILLRKTHEDKTIWKISMPIRCEQRLEVNPESQWINTNYLALPLKIYYFLNASVNPGKYKQILVDHLTLLKNQGTVYKANCELNICCAGNAEDMHMVAQIAENIFPSLFKKDANDLSAARLKIIYIPFYA